MYGQRKHSKESILTEIFRRLPQDSGIRDIDDLLVTESRFSSNSTLKSPRFYFYTRSGNTFTYSEPVSINIYYDISVLTQKLRIVHVICTRQLISDLL